MGGRQIAAVSTALALLLAPATALAYIGPGAGVALGAASLVLITTIVMAFGALLSLPFRLLRRALRRRRAKPLVRRVIIVGFDGQDPRLTERWMQEGKLPGFSDLAQRGCYSRLRTTSPPLSPTAWSSFATGTEPAKHAIYDFLTRDPRTYLPQLSSAHIGDVERFLQLGRYRIPLRKPSLRLLRKSKATWTILGEHGIWSTVLRVPISFPPEKFHGAQLSAMCTPDLLGTQGTFLLFTTRAKTKFKEGGIHVALERNGETLSALIEGPPNPFLDEKLRAQLQIVPDRAARRARIEIDDVQVELSEKCLSGWIHLTLRGAPRVKVAACCRMMVTEMDEHFSLYVTPLNIDPETPAMPISHPSYYSSYLAKRIGTYCTLGLAEDTWALNEGVIDEDAFLQQAYDIDREREKMLLIALDRMRSGALTCVFDATDRIQHMFWRYQEPDHPAAREREPRHADAIENIYRRNDELVRKLLAQLGRDDLLLVLSDHGFSSFRRGFNPNAWLLQNGYLALKADTDGTSEWLRDVDWSKTRAYAIGLTGIFLNLQQREAKGIVDPRDAPRLKQELLAAINGLRDGDAAAVHEVMDTSRLYHGPYLENAPDLLIGYNHGYRCSWDGASGVVAGPIFEDNVRAWSGDHCIDPRLVPGVLFASHKIDRADPALIDVAPTVLRLFGIDPPAHMDGRPLYEDFRA